MKTYNLIDLGRVVKVTATSFIGNRPEVANPNLRYAA